MRMAVLNREDKIIQLVKNRITSLYFVIQVLNTPWKYRKEISFHSAITFLRDARIQTIQNIM